VALRCREKEPAIIAQRAGKKPTFEALFSFGKLDFCFVLSMFAPFWLRTKSQTIES
jgi:hypothetical protein